jgi:competence protein ComEC
VWGGARLEVLAPAPDAHFEKVNDQSLVLKIVYGEVSVLLPGDAEAEAEEAMLTHPEALAATILKAPHHGSKTSSSEAFVQAVHPRFVVFCVGPGNRFHFPAPSIDARYAAAGCQRFRTDRDGAVTFHTDGHAVRVERFLQGNQVPNLR